jgi:serine protease
MERTTSQKRIRRLTFPRAGGLLCALALALIAPFSQATVRPVAAQAGPAGPTEPVVVPMRAANTAEPITDRVIVKYRDQAATQGLQAGLAGKSEAEQATALSATAGQSLSFVRDMSDGAQVWRITLPASAAGTAAPALTADTAETVAARLAALPGVEYAEPDRIRRAYAIPNDPGYSSQWHYSDAVGGIDAPAAWDLTTGSPNLTVAVIDTGLLYNHPDLANRAWPGYDFVSDSFMANDGDGRDADATDPGDWITQADLSHSECYGAQVENSSWHGTHVAGTIAAATNNGVGVAGINWNSKVLPVRVLGKCGGYDSDIADAMRWAAGLSVSGVPANPHPARVLNFSLGGSGSCPATYQNAINAVRAVGAVVVVAAGNSNQDVSNSAPANCSGVIAVAATTKTGSRASYSNYGSGVTVAAPGGDSAGYILSTWNSGTTTAGTNGYGYMAGTSMATPHVVGVVSLMLSVNPNLTPDQVTQYIRSTARAFPSGSSCSTSICGAGIVDAAAAVRAAGAAVGPTITSLSPAWKQVGSAGFTLTVNGQNFASDATVLWNGATRTTTFVSSTKLTAVINTADLAATGFDNVTVRRTDNMTSAPASFVVMTVRSQTYLPFIGR